MRGFLQEILSLAAWVLALFAIHNLHNGLTDFIEGYTNSETSSAVFAFALLLLIPYAAMKLIASMVGNATKNSRVGPVDKLLGFGFGAIKGLIMAVLAFALLALGYDSIWGVTGRPGWITTARCYPFINASSSELVKLLHERRRVLLDKEKALLQDEK